MIYSPFNRNEYQKIFLGVKRGQRLRLTTYCQENVGASTSHNRIGLHGLLQK
jgi:hypothetical protein